MAYLLTCVVCTFVFLQAPEAFAANYTFCMRYPDGQHYDSSVTSGGTDYGETYGRNGVNWEMSRMAVSVVAVTGGATVFTGQVDSAGCTTQFSSTSDKFNVYYSPYYYTSANDVSIRVYDCPAGANCQFPLYSYLNYDPAASSGTYNVVTPTSYVMSAYVAAAWIADRFIDNYFAGGSSHDFKIWSTGPSSSGGFTDTVWDGVAQDPVMRYHSVHTKAKFTIAHEFGHGIMLDLVGGTYVLNCSFGSGGTYNHTMTGQEYQSCASTEGWADFVSAVTWNAVATGAGGVLVNVTDATHISTYDIENGSKTILDYCNTCSGYGTEIDWLRFFWDYRTDSGTQPLIDDMMDVIPAADPWHSGLGHYNDWYDAVNTTLGGTQATRFASKASTNGTDW